MKKKSRGQVSVEYVLIMGFVILALTLAVGVAFTYASTAQVQIKFNQIDKIGKKMIETADSIYYLGEPSKSTIDLNMPDNIREIVIDRSRVPNSIQFIAKRSGPDAYFTYYTRGLIYDNGQPLNVSTFKSSGLKRLVINMTNNYVMFTPI
jgi:hypothetical protein